MLEENIASQLERSFREVDTLAIEAEIDTVEVEDGWLLVERRLTKMQREFTEEESRAMLTTSQHM